MCEKVILDYFKNKYETRKNLKVKVNRFLGLTSAIKELELYPGGKRVIRYKAPPKGAKATTVPPYVPAITRYTRNKEDKTNNFVLFGDDSSVEFTFTHPLVEYDQSGQLLRHYNDDLSVGDRLLIWQNIDSRGEVAHLTGHIITKSGKHYSIGFGFSGKKEYTGALSTLGIQAAKQMMDDSLGLAQGVIYTPDNVFEQKLLAQCTKKGNFVKLVSAVDITEQHLTNLRNSFDIVKSIDRATLRFTMVPDKSTATERSLLQEKLSKMISLGMYDKQYNAELQEYSDYVGNPEAKYKCIYSIGYSLLFPMSYCRFSGKRSVDKTYNCASFLHSVFADSIDCGKLSYLVIDPTRCNAGALSQVKCDHTVKMQNKQQGQELQRMERQLQQLQERQRRQMAEQALKAKAPKPPRVKKQRKQQDEQFFDAVQYM